MADWKKDVSRAPEGETIPVSGHGPAGKTRAFKS